MPGSLGKSPLPARSRGHAALRTAFPAWLALAACAHAAEKPLLSMPAPSAPADRPETRSAVTAVETAVQAGLASLAENIGASALAKLPASDPAARRVRIALADARLQRGAYAEVEKILREIPGSAADKSLRLGLAALGARAYAEARSHLADANRGRLDGDDLVWREILNGFVAAEDGRNNAAEQSFNSAAARAKDPLLSTQVSLLRIRMRMRLRTDDSDTIDDIGKIADIISDPRQAFQLVKLQSFRLHREGKSAEAAERMKRVPVTDPDLAAERDLLAGILSGRTDGRPWLVSALGREGFPEIQTAALAAMRESVVSAAPGEVVANANAVYNALTLFATKSREPSRVADLVHYTRAAVMLASAQAVDARERAKPLELANAAVDEVVANFPASPLRTDALALSADIAWQSGAYRKAADALVKLVERVPAAESGGVRLFAADCYFLNGDYALAAEGYARARPYLGEGAPRGEALLGEVRSRLEAGDIAEAVRALTAAALPSARIPAAARLRAEWLAADAQRTAGDYSAALARTNAALAALPAGDSGMRVRFLWLRAMTELDSRKNTSAAATAAELAALVKPGAPAEIADNAQTILAQTSLLKARALLGSGGHDNTGKNFAELREKFPGQASTAASYLVEGRYLDSEKEYAKALAVFKNGYELFKDDPRLVPYAVSSLYEAGSTAFKLSDRRGKEGLQEAFDLFDILTKKHPGDPRFFSARLMQGDILRSMNGFDSALKVYEDLITTRPNDPDRIRAELGKADCLYEQGSGDEKRADRLVLAAAEYERLYNLPKRPASLAAEVACKRADALAKIPPTGEPDPVAGARIARTKAAAGLWSAVDALLGSPAETDKLGVNGRFWVSKSFLLISDLLRQNGDLPGARAALKRLLDYNAGLTDGTRRLPGAALARERLDSLSASPALRNFPAL